MAIFPAGVPMRRDLPSCRICNSLLQPGEMYCYVCGAGVGVPVRKLRRAAYSLWVGRRLALGLWGLSAAWVILSLFTGFAMILWFFSLLGGLLLLRCAEIPPSNRLFSVGLANLVPVVAVVCALRLMPAEWDEHVQVVSLITGGAAFVLNCVFVGRAWRYPMKEYAGWECRKCGYPLFGLKSGTCPECGQRSSLISESVTSGEKARSRLPRAQIKK